MYNMGYQIWDLKGKTMKVMKVGELIEILEYFNRDAIVRICTDSDFISRVSLKHNYYVECVDGTMNTEDLDKVRKDPELGPKLTRKKATSAVILVKAFCPRCWEKVKHRFPEIK